jgi:hypothetical protein
MKVNPFVYGIIVLVLFFGILSGAKAMGVWSVSGKLTSSGEKVAPTGQSVDEIKGWMTLGDVTKAYNVPLAGIIAEFELPADTQESAQLKELESEKFSVTALRTWITEQQAQQQ